MRQLVTCMCSALLLHGCTPTDGIIGCPNIVDSAGVCAFFSCR
jgi:hypothetical protein